MSFLLEHTYHAPHGQAQRLVSARTCVRGQSGIRRVNSREGEEEGVDVRLLRAEQEQGEGLKTSANCGLVQATRRRPSSGSKEGAG